MDKALNALKKSRLLLAIVFVCVLLSSNQSFATTGPSQFSMSGGLYDASGDPIEQSNVDFVVQILDKSGTCVLYQESHLGEDLSGTKGGFALTVGTGTSRVNNVDGLNALAANVFQNNGVTAVVGCAAQNFAAGDERVVRVSYDLNHGGGLIAMTPDIPMTGAAYSMIAETLQGKAPADLIQVRNDNSSYFLSQGNVETVFDATNWPRLQALLNGSSTQYMVSSPSAPVSFNNQRITGVSNPSAATDAANRQYVDGNIGGYASVLSGIGTGMGAGSTLVWDAVDNRWEIGTVSALDATKLPLTGGTMSGAITMGGFDIYNTGHITMGNQRLMQLGTFNSAQETALTLGVADAGKIFYNTQTDSLRIWNGSTSYGVVTSVPVTSVAGKTGDVSLNIVDIAGAGTAALRDVGVAANNVLALDASSRIPAVDGGLLANVNATRLQGRTVAAAVPAADQVLRWNAGLVQWEPSTLSFVDTGITSISGDVVANGSGAVVATISTNAITNTKIADDQVTSNKLKSTGVAINRLLITDASTGATIDYANCAQDQILKFNTSLGWGCASDVGAASAVTYIGAGSGLVGGPITATGTLSVNTGVGANQIVQLDSSSRLPAVDGGLVTNSNAQRLQGRAISSVAPNNLEVLNWNSSSAQWEPIAVPSAPVQSVNGKTGVVTIELADIAGAGDVTEVTAGNALVGGGTSGNVTLAVNTGVGANQIMQLDSSSRAPGVDGGLMTNLNAVRLQSRAVSATAPSDSQVLSWNAAASEWRAVAIPSAPVTSVNGKTGVVTIDLADIAGAGDITQVVAGLGATGGGTAGVVTVGVDAGVGANQIVQLDASSRLPAVDGGLVTNSNAQRLQGRALSSVAPNNLEVLNWNSGSAQWEPIAIPSAPVLSVNGKAGVVTIDLADIAGAGDVTEVTAGNALVGGGVSGNVTLAVNTGVGANQIMQLDSSSRAPGVDGGLMTNLNAVRLQARAVSATAPTDAQVLSWNAAASEWRAVAIPSAPVTSVNGKTGVVTIDLADIAGAGDITQVVAGLGATGGGTAGVVTVGVDAGVGANQIVQLDASSRLPAVDGGLVTNSNAQRLQGRALSSVAPNNLEVLNWNSGSAQWEPIAIPSAPVQSVNGKTGVVTIDLADIAGAGDVTEVTAGNALVGGGTSGNVTLAVNTGVGANQIMQLDSSSRAPGVDGGLMTNLNAVRLQARAVSSAAPTADQVLRWNNGLAQWEPSSISFVDTGITSISGDMVANGSGSVVATISANAITNTKIADDQITSNKLKSTGIAINRLLITDASTGATIDYASCAQDQILKFNTSLGWGCAADAGVGAAVTYVGTGNGLLGGPISATGTVSVDAGVGANQIVQLDSSSRLPAVDGGLLTNSNAQRLQGRALSSVAPSNLEVLNWNSGSAQWEPIAIPSAPVQSVNGKTGVVTIELADIAGAGDITGVSAGYGLLGGGSSGNVTLSLAFPMAATGAGNASAPMYSFAGDADNGMFQPAVNEVAFSTAGTQRLMINGSGNVGIGTSAPTIGSILDLTGTGAAFSSIIIPRETTALRPVVGVNGMMRFNTTTNKFEVYEGTWQNMISSAGGGSGDFLAAGTVPMTGNLRLGGNWLSNDGGNEGIRVANNGHVGVGTAPSSPLHVVATTGDLVRLETTSAAAPVAIRLVAYDSGSIYRDGYLAFTPVTGTNQSFITLGSTSEDIFNIKMNGRVGVRTTAPTTGTSLDVTGTGVAFSSMIIPRDTTALRPTTGVNGMIRFNTTTQKFEAYEGTWQNMISSGGGGSVTFPLLATTIGSATAPAYSFSGDDNTGIFSEGADDISFATNGVSRLQIDSSGNVGIGSSNNPVFTLRGYITEALAMKATSLQVNDTTNNLELTREDSDINAFSVQMPTTFTTTVTETAAASVSSGASYAIPDRSRNIRRIDLTSATPTITLPSLADLGADETYTLTIKLAQVSSSAVITWDGGGATIKWDGGTAPVIASGNGQETIVQLTAIGGTSVWYGAMVWREN